MAIELEDMGIKAVENVENVNSGTLVIRAHGVPDSTIEAAEKKGSCQLTPNADPLRTDS